MTSNPAKQGGIPDGPAEDRPPCAATDCDRPSFAKGLCQTHYRQQRTTGKVKRIRPYRPRSSGTVKFSGLRLTSRCAELVQEHARQRGISAGAAIAELLEDWYASGRNAAQGSGHSQPER
jgi:hypothetical protein